MNKLYLTLTLGLLLTIFINASIIEKEYILLDIKYENNEFTLVSKTLEEGNYPSINHNPQFSHDVNLLSEDGTLLYSNSIDPLLFFAEAPGEEHIEGGAIYLSETEFYLIIPSDKTGDKVEILKDGIKVFEEEVYNVGAETCRIR